jgi:methionyl-tRNA formyltransferase
MKVIVAAYRPWAIKAATLIPDNAIKIVSDPGVLIGTIKCSKPTHIILIGWSWIIPNDVVDEYKCYCVHPSPLPKYRGGSPIQHQIINGEIDSAVTIFRVTHDLDAGPIVYSEAFRLLGSLSDIYNRVGFITAKGIIQLLYHTTAERPQVGEPTYYKRRTPEQSELTIDELKTASSHYLYNKIRALNGEGYPPMYWPCADGKRLKLLLAEVE